MEMAKLYINQNQRKPNGMAKLYINQNQWKPTGMAEIQHIHDPSELSEKLKMQDIQFNANSR